jgi:hypothetical protein
VPCEHQFVFARGEARPEEWHDFRRAAYSYLLGLYLGDGYVGRPPRTFSLVIACDARQGRLVAECFCAVAEFADNPPSLHTVGETNGVRVVSYGKAWPVLIPQAETGKKHERQIELREWQREIVRTFPEQLIRGLIHSDGARCSNSFTVQLKSGPKRYSYPRYFFSNYSADIREIFTGACDQLGIRWSLSNWRNVSISHRDSVARLDEFVGPKS